MGNELIMKYIDQKNEDITNDNENGDLFQNISKENKLILKYKIDYPGESIRLVGSKFYENNKDNCKMCIEFEVKDLMEFYQAKNNESFIKLTLAISHKITDLSYMFYECSSLISITNLYDLNINNVTNLSYMFFGCFSLTSLSDISEWKINKVNDISHMFQGCSSLKSLPLISKWKTYNVIDMSYMFYNCSSLTSLDDISIWDISKVNNISLFFYNCPLLNNKEKILNIFFEKNPLLKIKDEEERRKEEEKRRIEEERKRKEEEKRRIEEERRKEKEKRRIEKERRRIEEEKRRIEEERRRIEKERNRIESEEKRKEEEIRRIEEEKRKRQKEEIIKKQTEYKKKKVSDENVKGVLEDMCILGSIMKKEIIEEKINQPEKFISIEEATKEKKNDGLFCLGILAQILENIGITTAIERNESIDKESENFSNTVLQFIMNGMIEKKKYDFHFDLGEQRNNELLYDLNEQKNFNNKLRKKLSKEYNIPEDKIIITNPQKGSYNVQLIFESEEFNDRNIDINQFKNNCTEKEFEELKNLKEIHTSLIMDGCKLTRKMLDSRGNRESGFEIGGKRGGYPYNSPLKGWKGFGLNVMDKYVNQNNDWLGCDGNKNEQAVAYHGIGKNAGPKVKEVTRAILKDGFIVGKGQAYEFDDNDNNDYKSLNEKEDEKDDYKKKLEKEFIAALTQM